MPLNIGNGWDEDAQICTTFGRFIALIISDKVQLVICDSAQQEVGYVEWNV